MNTTKIKYLVDVGMGVSFLLVAATGIMKFPGLIRTFGLTYQQFPMVLLSKIHDWSGITMAALVLVHLVLNWRWIVCTTRSFFRKDADGGSKCKK
jgi:hypothetical protein